MARKVTYDQDKVKELRMAVIEASLYVMADKDTSKWSDYKRELILKYAPRVLPTINEHSGPEGSPIPLLNYAIRDHIRDTQNSDNDETSADGSGGNVSEQNNINTALPDLTGTGWQFKDSDIGCLRVFSTFTQRSNAWLPVDSANP